MNNKPVGIRLCTKCNCLEYHNKGQSHCKSCYKKWYSTYKDKGKRDAHYKRKFGISLAEYNRMLEEQNGVCAVCKGEEPKRYKNIAVDHNHTTGEVRGLLCSSCNRALGLLQDNELIIEELLKYKKERG